MATTIIKSFNSDNQAEVLDDNSLKTTATITGTVVTDPDANIHDSAGNPLTSTGTSLNTNVTNTVPVTGPLTDVELRASPVEVDGSGVTQPVSAVSLPLPTGASTEAKQDVGNASLSSIDSKLTSPIAVTGPLTDTQLRATPVPVSGTVTATPTGTQDVNIVSSVEVEVKNDSGNPIPVSGTVAATQSGTWNINDISGTVSLPTGAAIASKQSALDFRGASQVAFPEGDYELDAFGRMRISQIRVLFESLFTFNLQPDYWTSSVASGGTITYNSNESAAELNVTTTNGSSAVYRTKRYIPYQAGRSQLITVSSVFGAAKTGVRKRVGYFDSNDGVYLEQTTTDLRWVVRTSTSGSVSDSNFATQANWNVDKLDGTGRSGITLDITKIQLLVIDFAWQAAGVVRVGFQIDGKIIYVNKFFAANVITTPWCKSGTLPVRAEITNTAGTASNTTLKIICTQVASETGQDPIGIVRTASNGITVKTVGTSFTPLVSIRLKSTALTHSLEVIKRVAYCTSADNINFSVTIGGTLTGASFNSVDTNSIAEFDVAATAISGGVAIEEGFFTSAAGASSYSEVDTFYSGLNAYIGSLESGASEILTLSARAFAGTATCVGALTFMEWL